MIEWPFKSLKCIFFSSPPLASLRQLAQRCIVWHLCVKILFISSNKVSLFGTCINLSRPFDYFIWLFLLVRLAFITKMTDLSLLTGHLVPLMDNHEPLHLINCYTRYSVSVSVCVKCNCPFSLSHTHTACARWSIIFAFVSHHTWLPFLSPHGRRKGIESRHEKKCNKLVTTVEKEHFHLS